MNNIHDFLDISDEIVKGFVIIKDQTGKILVQKKNMILKDGKYVLLARFLNNFNSQTNSDVFSPFINKSSGIISDSPTLTLFNKLINYSLYKAIFYNKNDEVSYTDNTGSLGLSNIYKDNTTIDRLDYNFIENQDEKNVIIETEDDHLSLKFSFSVSFDNPNNAEALDSRTVNSLSLVMKNFADGSNNDSEFALFSRIRFDPIILTPESTLTVQYYVYF